MPPTSIAARWGLPLALVIVSVVTMLLHVRAYTVLSPIDELQHLDYLDQASRFDLVQPGERVGELAMREEACRGIDAPGFVTPPCNAPELSPEQFQELGINTASSHPPVYYTVAGLGARFIDALPGIDSFLTAGRLTGALFLAAGAVLTYVLARRLRARAPAAMGAAGLVVTTPVVLHSSAVVNNDAPSLLIGAGVVLAALAVAEGRLHPWCLALLAMVATSLKVTNLAVVGCALLILLMSSGVRALSDPRSSRFKAATTFLLWPVAIGGLALVPPLAWAIVGHSYAVSDAPVAPMTANAQVDAIGLDHFIANLFSTLTPVQNAYVPHSLNTPLIVTLMIGFNLVLAAAVVGLSWRKSPGETATRVARASLFCMLLAGPLFVLLVFVFAGSYVAIPPRYGLSLVPAAAAVLAVAASSRRIGRVGLPLLGAVSVLATWSVLV
jgi:hypothetical protein